MKIWDKILSCVGAQVVDTSGHYVFDLENIEFHWENLDLNMDTIFQLGKDPLISPSIFVFFEMGSMAENPFLIDKEQDTEKSRFPSTSVSHECNEPLSLLRWCPFGSRFENVLEYHFRILFEGFCFGFCNF